jgi:hypothetical protein
VKRLDAKQISRFHLIFETAAKTLVSLDKVNMLYLSIDKG